MVCDVILPPHSADLCDPKVGFGGIDKFYFTRNGDGLTDASSETEWTARLSNTTVFTSGQTGLAPIRMLFTRGSMPLPEQSEIRISGQRSIFSKPEHTVTLTVDDTGETNLAALCAYYGKTYTMTVWFESNGQLVGGNDGLTAQVTFNGLVIPEAETEVRGIQITVKWKNQCPEIVDYPLSLAA